MGRVHKLLYYCISELLVLFCRQNFSAKMQNFFNQLPLEKNPPKLKTGLEGITGDNNIRYNSAFLYGGRIHTIKKKTTNYDYSQVHSMSLFR